MTNKKLAKQLTNLSENPSLMTHIVYGFPTPEKSEELVKILDQSGSMFIEVQIPFSDPMADGPTIMSANDSALSQGVTPKKAISAIAGLSKEVEAPIIVMTYFNIILSYGVEKFCKDCQSAGVAGLIVPDLPFEEAHEGLFEFARTCDLEIIPVVSPVTNRERLEKINQYFDCSFVYCLSRTGTTGVRSDIATDLAEYLKLVKEVFQKPLALGFGISSKEHIQALKGKADIAVVGSATIEALKKNDMDVAKAGDFIRSLLT